MERIIIHGGTPKTGTTSLQFALDANRKALAKRGWLYPTIHSTEKPKHQWLVGDLLRANQTDFQEHLDAIFAEAEPHTKTAVLSTEGIFNHWWDFPDDGRALLAHLAARLKVELWVWFREPVSFFSAYYVQLLKNLPGGSPCTGRDLSPEQMLDEPWCAQHLDYSGFIDQATSVIGAGSVRVFEYRRSTIADFMRAAGFEETFTVERDDNRSTGELGAQMLRLINRREMSNEARSTAVSLIERIDAADGRRPLEILPATRTKVRKLAAKSIDRLKSEFGFDLNSSF
jgi:hypothetical protein